MTFEEARSLACPLLSLPGELRNRIYDYCIEPGAITLRPAHRRHRYNPSAIPFWGLRYTCRVLYTEYTPIYLARTTVSLQPSDVERYLLVFYPRPSTHQIEIESSKVLAPNIHGDILIYISLGETLDLTSFAGLQSRAPNIRIRIARGAAISPMMKDGIEILRTITDASCSIDFEHTVERVLFRYSLRAELVVKLHRGVQYERLLEQAPDRSPRSWLVQQGLSVLSALKVVMEGSEGVVRDHGQFMTRGREVKW